MAGLAETCSHVGAILHWIEAAVRINMSTTSTSRENSWLMPTAIDNIPFLELKNISFTAASKSVAHSAQSLPSPPPIPTAVEKENFFKELSKEQNKIPIILSVVSPYNASFITSDEHLPQLFSTLYDPINSEKSQSELLQLAADYSIEPTTTDKVKRLATITADQSKSKVWFQYRAGRITASRLKQVTRTSAIKPSISLIKSICYPDVYLFHNNATKYGCTHESDALLAYERKSVVLHQGFATSRCGFFVSTDYPFLGASPDGLVECSCCGKGVLEIKCPFRCKESTIKSLVDSSTDFYLKRQSDGIFSLDHDHSYYYQCQLQMFVTDRQYCDFVVWSKESQLHVERITLDESFIQAQMPIAMKFWRLCILPELLGKLYSRQQTMSVSEEKIEEDQGKWCHCKQEKGGEMIGCDNKTCKTKWYHIECVSMSSRSIPQGKWFCPACRPSLKNT
uniref:PHD-type domain-containing protein n=1 Tax=Amphimedon queenslandica TaxID=400682 RepID=A0A1X7TJH5_AMPQE